MNGGLSRGVLRGCGFTITAAGRKSRRSCAPMCRLVTFSILQLEDVTGRGNTPMAAGIAPGQLAWARDYATGGRNRARSACLGAGLRQWRQESRPVSLLGRGITPPAAGIAPGQLAWARDYATGGRNRARSACYG